MFDLKQKQTPTTIKQHIEKIYKSAGLIRLLVHGRSTSSVNVHDGWLRMNWRGNITQVTAGLQS